MPPDPKVEWQQRLVGSWQRLLTEIRKPREINQLFKLAAAVIVLVLMVSVLTGRPGAWAVEINNQVVAMVEDKVEAREILADIMAEQSEELGRPVNLTSTVFFRPVDSAQGRLLKGDALKMALEKAVSFYTSGVAVKVDGQVKLVVRDMQTGEALLSKLKDLYHEQGDIRVEFAEGVELAEENVLAVEILDLEDAFKLARQGGREIQTYQVKNGDNLWDIASAHKITVEELQAANPGLRPEGLQIGQEIQLSMTTPLINVLSRSNLHAVEEIPFEIEERRDDKLYLGEQQVIQQGKPGKREVLYQVTRRNGLVVDKEVVEDKVIEPAETKVVAKGSRMLLASRSGGSGRLAYPTVGSIISPYGMRSGRMHQGVDISGNTGSPVVAAESGRVIGADWNGGYGKCIDVSHGDGVVTRYAHLSSFNVEVGQQVVRGQLIGRVGSTGRSTGPHLHFEVLVNGSHKDPTNFI